MTINGDAIQKNEHSAQRLPQPACTQRNAGNIFFALFAAVAMVGTIGYGFNSVMRGPISGMSEVTKRTVAESTLVTSTRLAIVGATTDQTAGGDCDSDGSIEPLPYRDAGALPHPAGGGFLPTDMLPDSLDPWKSEYGYCAWDSGSLSVSDNVAGCGGSGALRLEGGPDNTRQAIAIISAGKDRRFQTSCVAYNPATPNADLLVRTPGSDDIVLGYTYAEANDLGNGLWTPSADPLKTNTTTTTPKNIEVGGSASFSDKVVLTGGGLVLPDQNSTGACDSLANDKQIRRNTSTNPPTIEICDFSGGLDWTPLAGTVGDGEAGESGLSGTMVAHWKLDETSGTVAHDELERLNGTLVDGPTWDGTGGAIGGAINFSGTPDTQAISIPRSKLLEPTAITVSTWIKRASTQPTINAPIIGKIELTQSGYQNSYSLRLHSTNHTVRFPINTTAGVFTATSVDTVPENTWTHVLASYDPARTAPQLKIYVNGQLSGSQTVTHDINYQGGTEDSNLNFGISSPGNINRFNGAIDDVRIYNYALTDDQVRDIYELGVPEINLQRAQKPGRLMSWGPDTDELLGNGPDEGARDIPAPVLVNSADFVDVSTTTTHSCAIKKDGTVWCWGLDDNGQLGNGATTTTTQSTPVKVDTINDAVQIANGLNFSCALRKSGAVWCWGSNSYGKFGNGNDTNSSVPVKGPSYEDFHFIAAGGNTACGIRQNGEAWCWGSGASGQLGNGAAATSYLPVKVSNIDSFAHLSIYGGAVCGVATDGKGYCWGNEIGGAFGNGATSTQQNVPSQILNITDFVKLSMHTNFACGLRANGQIWCWGTDSTGRLGNGPSAGSSDIPTQVVNIDDFIDVEIGNSVACGIRKGGSVWCWGDDTNGKLGNGPSITASQESPYPVTGANFLKMSLDNTGLAIVDTTPIKTAPLATAQHRIAGGVNSRCAIKTDGILYCWGSDLEGQLGNGSGITADQEAPYPITNSTGAQSWVMVSGGRLISGGRGHYCGIKTDGTAWCWGFGTSGQLGAGNNSSSTVPVQVTSIMPSTTPWSTIDAAASHSCGIKADGTLWCWGKGSEGQLGNNGTGNSNTPVQIASTIGWKSISLGSDDTCGIKVDGTLWCWGLYLNGRLGLGSSIAANQTTPQQVGTSTDWTSVSAGANHTCAIKTDGSAWCWGLRNNGRLGIGSITGTSYTPEMVRDPGPWAVISASYNASSTCGIKMDGSAWCWGMDSNGQLGNGSTITADQWIPYPVSGGGTWKAINAGNAACGIKADDSMWCWGDDTNGKLGNGSTITAAQHAPYPVSFTPPKAKFIGDESGAGSLAQGNMALGTQGFVESTAASNYLIFPGSGRSVMRNTIAYADLLLDAQAAGNNAQFALGTTNNRYAFGTSATTGSFGLINTWGWLSDNNRALEVGINGNVGIGTNGAPAAKLDVAGGIKLSALTTCDASVQGTLKYESGIVQYCNTSNAWVPFGYTESTALWDTGKNSGGVQEENSCALKSDGTAWCWGLASRGVLGEGQTTTDRNTPVQVQTDTGPGFWNDWRYLATARMATAGVSGLACGIRANGSAWCWGTGVLGNGSGMASSSRPAQIQTNTGPGSWSDWYNISSGDDHSCGLRMDGSAWCWGQAGNGRLGNGTSGATQTRPVQVLQNAGAGVWNDWVEIAAGGQHTCGRRADGSAWCWGNPSSGRLGDGTTSGDKTQPVIVLQNAGGASWYDWISISAGEGHTCGIRANGSAWCWGTPNNYRLGSNDNSTAQSRPVEVHSESSATGWSDWVHISAGSAHTCGIRADGSAWCWGQNASGQLGNNGTGATAGRPVRVHSDTSSVGWNDWVDISAGITHTCGTRANGSLWCWGQGLSGKLGNGQSTTDALRPVKVQ